MRASHGSRGIGDAVASLDCFWNHGMQPSHPLPQTFYTASLSYQRDSDHIHS